MGCRRTRSGRIQRKKARGREREREGGIERDERGMAEKFLERRKEPGKMNSVSLQRRRREVEQACRTPGNRIARDYDYPWRRKGVIYPVAVLIIAPGHIIQPGVPHPEPLRAID